MASREQADRVSVLEILGGVEFPDPYRWLEDESPAAQAWERERHEAAGAVLAAMPGLQALVERLETIADHCRPTAPIGAGERWFEVGMHPSRSCAALMVGDEPGAAGGQVVAVAEDLIDGPGAGFDYVVPAPDGRHVAVGVSVAGDEQSVLHVLDVPAGMGACQPLPYTSGGFLSWLPDASGLYVGAGVARDSENAVKHLVFVELGGAEPRPVESLRSEERSLLPHVSPCGRWVGVATNYIAPRLRHVLDRSSGRWFAAAPHASRDHSFYGCFVDDHYVAVTTIGASRGRLVRASLDAIDDPARWDVLLPEGEGVMRSVSRAASGLVLCDYLPGGLCRVRLVSTEGVVLDEIPLPGEGAVTTGGLMPAQIGGEPPVHVRGDDVTFVFSSPTDAPTSYRYNFATRELATILGPLGPGLDDVDVADFSCRSADGREVPYVVIAPRERDEDSATPTAVVGYGGWNIVALARGYPAALAPIVEAGGALVIPHLRGDATHGFDQWQGGKLANKQRSFDDLYAVAEHLVGRRFTDSQHLAFVGSSNGGLLGGAILTQRPTLFRAVVSAVPLLDMGRFQIDHYSEMFAEEYGDPRRPADAAWLRAYSPYHNVVEGLDYPATLLIAGATDIRCQPWHARKMAAALEHAQAGSAPVLLRVHPDCGHASAAMMAAPARMAEWLGFLMHQIGLPLEARDRRTTGLREARVA